MTNNKQLIYKSDARRAVLRDNPASAYCIDDIKPVDAVEVKHGKWGPVKGFLGFFTWEVQCSLCETPQDQKSKFCPNCGAHMDLED